MANSFVKGIVIKQSAYGDGHRILSIFGEGTGIIKAISYGAGKSKSSNAASSQVLCYGTFSLAANGGRLMSVKGADITDSFYPISCDIKKLALVSYLGDITYEILGENNADDNILGLYLNTLYALAYRDADIKKAKAVYELRLMSMGGYMPALDKCVECGSDEVHAFDLLKGGAVCKVCGAGAVKVNKAVVDAIRYITGCDNKRMLSFEASEQMIDYLNKIAQGYVSAQLDKKFKSLDYYNTILLS